MDDFEEKDDDISLEDLEREESSEYSGTCDDWSDSYDDIDSEAWESEYGSDEDELSGDPWSLS